MLDLDGVARSFPTQTFLKSRAYSKLQGTGRERAHWVLLLSPGRTRRTQS